MREANMENLGKLCKGVMVRLMGLCLLHSLDPKIEQAIDELQKLRIHASNLFDVIAPDWAHAEVKSIGHLMRD